MVACQGASVFTCIFHVVSVGNDSFGVTTLPNSSSCYFLDMLISGLLFDSKNGTISQTARHKHQTTA